jgi:16S rRNA (adenine1518-N6/adenine1519-N6)-dimethyltransferase
MRRKQSSTQAEGGRPAGPPTTVRSRKRFGQNFLADGAAIRRIVAAVDPAHDDDVIEIGPGRGALTDALLAVLPRLSAIEIDRDLVAALRARYPEHRLRLIERDVLRVAFRALRRDGPLVVVGNLPYNISKPVAMKLIDERRDVARAVLMYQREVAARLTAAEGTPAYGPLTVLSGRAYRVERLFDLPPGAFQPAPKVMSTVTRWTPREDDALPEELLAPLKAVLRAAFARRRQTLVKNLRAALQSSDASARTVLVAAGLDGSLRAEAIPPEGFVALARAWPV